MARSLPSLHLVGDATGRRAGAVLAASQGAQLDGVVHRSPDFSTALTAPQSDREVMVLLAPQAGDISAALGALDARGLPRWAVVPSSLEEAQSAEFSGDEWDVAMLARSMRFAVALLALRRDNARLRGDLCTIGRRLAHDLRTPLNSINTANDALAEPVHAESDSAPRLHRVITAAVEEAADLIERLGAVLLASSRPLECKAVDMEEVIWNARQRLDGPVRFAGATIVSCEKWPVVSGVASLLELVWTNLLLNSLQHAGPAPRIEMGWNRLETDTRFWLRDSGAGVPPARRARLFHPVDRLNELNAPLGYGLSLVHRLVELHSGTTGYDPEPAPGGTFFFTLPSSVPSLSASA